MLLCATISDRPNQERLLHFQAANEKKMLNIAQRILKNSMSAEDVVQQTWLIVLRKGELFTQMPDDKMAAYIRRIVENTAKNLLKDERRNTELPANVTVETEANILDEIAYQHLVELIREMPELYSEILEMKFIQERSYEEISSATGLKEATVATRISRGRAFLIERLRQEGVDRKA